MVLEEYLKTKDVNTEDIFEKLDFTLFEVSNWKVIQYPDELFFVLSKQLKMQVSELLYELLHLENAGIIRRVASDYGLARALETEVTYIYIPKSYRKEESKFLVDLLLEKNIYEFERVPYARYNLFGKHIYESFLLNLEKGDEFKRLEKFITKYFVLVHDKSGSLLSHVEFSQSIK